MFNFCNAFRRERVFFRSFHFYSHRLHPFSLLPGAFCFSIFEAINKSIMKKLLNIYAGLLVAATASAQSVGIGTNNPNPKTILHINSTSRGILLPSMTNTQRLAIVDPPEGLVVYDLTERGLYQLQQGVWRQFITTDYWIMNNSRQAVYNLFDSVGIGTASPTERLSVNGNIRAGGDVKALGDIGAGTNSPEQRLHVRTNLNNQGILLDGPNPQIQLRQQVGLGVSEKGFIQLSGDDLRLGTNSSNTTGRVVFRTQGSNRLEIDNNGLHMPSNGKLTRAATSSKNLLPICYGRVDYAAASYSGTPNFTVTRIDIGEYEIDCPQFGANTVFVVTMNAYQGGRYAAHIAENRPAGSTKYRISFWQATGGSSEAGFSFIAYQNE